MPKTGASSVPTYCKAQNSVRANTEPVSTRMYQPSTRFSISMPQEVKRSAGHWKRKLRTRNGASIAEEEKRVIRLTKRSPEVFCPEMSWPGSARRSTKRKLWVPGPGPGGGGVGGAVTEWFG